MKGKVVGLYLAEKAGVKMCGQYAVNAIEGKGIYGDRYYWSQGSFNKGEPGKRQVTLMNAIFFQGSGYEYADSRRNIFTEGVELMWLIGREFQIGMSVFKGIKYCDPCDRPTKLSKKEKSFKESFLDRGGLVAEVLRTGLIKIGDEVVPPPKGY